MTTILSADDNEQSLGGNGYQVAGAADGALALALARSAMSSSADDGLGGDPPLARSFCLTRSRDVQDPDRR